MESDAATEVFTLPFFPVVFYSCLQFFSLVYSIMRATAPAKTSSCNTLQTKVVEVSLKSYWGQRRSGEGFNNLLESRDV